MSLWNPVQSCLDCAAMPPGRGVHPLRACIEHYRMYYVLFEYIVCALRAKKAAGAPAVTQYEVCCVMGQDGTGFRGKTRSQPECQGCMAKKRAP